MHQRVENKITILLQKWVLKILYCSSMLALIAVLCNSYSVLSFIVLLCALLYYVIFCSDCMPGLSAAVCVYLCLWYR